MHTLLVSPFYDPYLNLALENYFFETLNPEQPLLFLYVNEPSVIIGRFQNPWLETQPAELGSVHLVRRQSGGGTVYHDPGNLNFSFISSQEEYDKTANLEIICRIMEKAGVDLAINERHDLTTRFNNEVYKVSGSAFRLKKDKVFHHGTLLITSDKEKLKKAISPSEDRHFLKSGGTASKRSQVIALSGIVPKLSIPEVISHFNNAFMQIPVDWESLQKDKAVLKEIVHLKSPEWLFEKTPSFTQDLSVLFPERGGATVIRIKKGVISETPSFLNDLKGIPYGRAETETLVKNRMKKSTGKGGAGDEFFRRLIKLIR